MNQIKLPNKLLFKLFGGVWVLVCMIASTALILLNSTFIYRWVIDYYELPYITGLTRGELMENYLQIISYFRNPWVSELYLTDFKMSEAGSIHFEEVRQIFQGFYFIIFISLISFIIIKLRGKSILPILNMGTNFAIIMMVIVGISMTLDFTKTFVFFHLIIFKNDYWLFDPLFDPVILALPEELFMILGVVALFILLLQILLIKILYINQKRKN